ncbi:hypothetical protein KHP57_11040 [Algiphilus sp. NNCM1]|nr:hypothetical protein [Algiphilus acroporae]MCI5063179.1 hypothetical protein [Algiphilus sp.]
MSKQWIAAPLAAMALLLTACGGGSDTGASAVAGDSTAPPSNQDIFARIDCNVSAQGPFAGPLDNAQTALIEQTANAIGGNSDLGDAGVNVIIAVARLLDVVDALATLGQNLAANQDPRAAASELLGVTQAIQCGAASLADAAASTDLVNLPFANQLIDDLRSLALGIDTSDPNFLGASGLEDLTTQLANISSTLSDIIAVLGVDPSSLGLPQGTQALLRIPAELFKDLSETLLSIGQLDGEATSNALATTITGVLEGVAALLPNDAAAGPLAQAREALANGLARLLVPLFDAISQQLSAGGRSDAEFGRYLAGGFSGRGDPEIESIIAGGDGAADGVPRPTLGELLAALPIVGQILDALLPLKAS